jgi:hypothetical protein
VQQLQLRNVRPMLTQSESMDRCLANFSLNAAGSFLGLALASTRINISVAARPSADSRGGGFLVGAPRADVYVQAEHRILTAQQLWSIGLNKYRSRKFLREFSAPL